jgi:phage FluMu protein Com
MSKDPLVQKGQERGVEKMEEIRCKKCRRLLMKVVNNFDSCGVYIKCPKCHYYQHFGSVLETEEEKNLGKENQRRT